jgi:hypothetical protein
LRERGGVGENVAFQGDVHAQWTQTVNDNRYTYHENFNPQGIKGIGQVTGAEYKATGKTSFQFGFYIADGFPYEQTFINQFHLVGPGPGNDFYVKNTIHLTVNGIGDVTANHDFSEITCK